LLEDVGYIAYHFHWSHEQIMGMEHRDRQQWVDQISQINQGIGNG
jgi:hypothetical protein